MKHQRKNKPKVDRRYSEKEYTNGYPRFEGEDSQHRVGKTGYLDKSMHGFGDKAELSDKIISATIGNDFTNGHRGMARAVKGAKKYVRSRTRFHENNATRKLMKEYG